MAQPPQRVPGGWNVALAVGVLGVGLSVVAVLSSVAGPVSNSRGLSLLPQPTDEPPAARAHPSIPPSQTTSPGALGSHSLLWVHVTVAVVVALALLVLAGLIWRYRSGLHLPHWTPARARVLTPPTFTVASTTTFALAEQARRALAGVSWDDGPRAGVIGCWDRLERAAAAAGLADASSSPAALVTSLLTGAQVPAPLVAELRRAFERARFSTHTVTDADWQAARALLERVLGALDVRHGARAGTGPLRETSPSA